MSEQPEHAKHTAGFTGVLSAFNRGVCEVFGVVAAGLLAGMTGVILMQVFCRYVLGQALPWPEELARYMMVWMTFLAAPAAYRNRLNVRLDTALDAMPSGVRRGVEIFGHALIIVVALALLRESLWMIERGGFMRASSMEFRMAYVYAVIPAGLGMIALVGVERIVLLTRGESLEPAPPDAKPTEG